tara:strand:- start:1079 stop:1360 length:282 start_codon:yes stop_codon:yes gene_type:complete
MPRYHNVNGQSVQFTSQEETARDAEEASWAAAADTRAAIQVREKRNGLLAETDWMGNNDVTMSDAWTAYRAALRNVPAQGGFPNSITWPTKPN